MSSDQTPNVPAARGSREAVREKAQRVQARQSRVRIMRRVIVGLVAVVAVGSIGVAVAFAINSSISKRAPNPSGMINDGVTIDKLTLVPEGRGSSADATSASAEGSATPTPDPTEKAAPATEIHIYVDYLSAGASEFERTNARQLARWISDGAVTVTYHPVALFIASSNGTRYSLRAASAAACVATYSPDKFFDYNHELLTDQPEINSDGRTDVELADLAVAVGVQDAKRVRSCVEGEDFIGWAKEATTRALDGPLPGSHSLKLTNEALVVVSGAAYVGSLSDPAEFSQFVLTTASDEYYGETDSPPTPTPTPTPTSSASPTPTKTPAS